MYSARTSPATYDKTFGSGAASATLAYTFSTAVSPLDDFLNMRGPVESVLTNAVPGFDFRDKLFKPETLLMELPPIGGATGDEGMARREKSAFDEQSGIKVAVPRAALMQSNALVIDEAKIELECVFDRFATEADGRRSCAPRLGVWLDRTGSGSPARIVIKFKRVDRPEGASRIEDALLRNIQ